MIYIHIVLYHTSLAENIGTIKHWQIQLFRLFGGERFGEWPNNGKWISDAMSYLLANFPRVK